MGRNRGNVRDEGADTCCSFSSQWRRCSEWTLQRPKVKAEDCSGYVEHLKTDWQHRSYTSPDHLEDKYKLSDPWPPFSYSNTSGIGFEWPLRKTVWLLECITSTVYFLLTTRSPIPITQPRDKGQFSASAPLLSYIHRKYTLVTKFTMFKNITQKFDFEKSRDHGYF